MSSTSASHISPPIFDGKNYQVWAVKMETFLRAYDLWTAIETEEEPAALRDNATINQIKQHSEKVAKRYRALSFIQAAVSEKIFSRIMSCKTAKKTWTKLEEDYLVCFIVLMVSINVVFELSFDVLVCMYTNTDTC
ncbi:Uncharacterized protein TCM_026102 [Theobroma cacao]|uniref:Uncharacterized protein n=1 Tax=Theobroma cacao TaxID=3641 RepID=A0A061F8G3_THECC|nr:Uncharacterized protein TCM_026102 [Theobroma cacao]